MQICIHMFRKNCSLKNIEEIVDESFLKFFKNEEITTMKKENISGHLLDCRNPGANL